MRRSQLLHVMVSMIIAVSIVVMAASTVAAQSAGIGSSPTIRIPNPNPLFPERIGIPWLAVPQLGSYPPSSSTRSMPPPSSSTTSIQVPSITSGAILQSETVYVGGVPVRILPLPLPANPIVSRLRSFGFFLQVPVINSPIENLRDR